MSTSNASAQYKLKSDDEQVFMVERRPMMLSATINQHFIDNGINDRNCDQMEPIFIPFSGEVIAMVIRWLYHHQDDRPKEEKIPYKEFSQWDKEFLSMEPGLLFAVLNASHHLGIEDLMNMGCAAAAELIRGKSTSEIREIYGIKSDAQKLEESIANGEPGPSGLNKKKKDKKAKAAAEKEKEKQK